MHEPLAIDVKVGSPVTVTVRGDLDLHTVPALRRTLRMLRDDDVVIDCAELHFLDSSGIAVLVAEQRERERLHRPYACATSPGHHVGRSRSAG